MIIKQEIIDCGGIENYLCIQQKKVLLRLFMCGNVDDGKSTLIGRLLHDSEKIYDDQLSMLQIDSKRIGTQKGKLDLALLMDGLQSERTQGITIDVAYRYFSTKRRKFIIADTPGHEEYTRNMVTGASTSMVAVLLIDVCRGMCDQTKRHWFISVLLGIKYIVVAINKMDVVNYSQMIFEKIKEEYLDFTTKCFLDINNVNNIFIPISAIDGDNILVLSKNMSWYTGVALISILENINVDQCIDASNQKLRFPVQYVIRNHLGFRGYSGTIASGSMYVGQYVRIFPSNSISTIRRIIISNNDCSCAWVGEAITLTLDDDLDVSRGDMLLENNDVVVSAQSALVDVIWMHKKSLIAGQSFDVKIANKIVDAQVNRILYKIDICTLSQKRTNFISVNEIGLIKLFFHEPLILDQYNQYPVTGSMIFIDHLTNETVGAGLVRNVEIDNTSHNKCNSSFEYELHKLIRRYFPHWNICDSL